ncbi:MAG TPA: FAD-dependent oxidoreductase [Ktedonobacteraceae bacterium]|nr:FAD-dependent oxidoreductase [Ktedonobacteraceae bacterium]
MFKTNAIDPDNQSTIQDTQPPTRILVIGAGYAGMLFTMRLGGKVARQNVQISLVSEFDTFTERLRLHQFATNQAVQWRSIPQMLRHTNIQFIQGRVTSIDPEQHQIVVMDQQQMQQLKYDYLVYALGSSTDRQSVPGVAEYAYTLAPNGPLSAAALREMLPSVQAKHGQVVICGGGATGIETAGEVANAYPDIRVRLVTQGSCGQFLGKYVANSIRRSLTRLGVEIIDHTTVTAVREHSVAIDQGSDIPYDFCLWMGGFVAPPLAREAGLEVNERNQIVVDPYLRSISHPEIYAIGDAAHPLEVPGAPVRMSAVTASIMGAHGADSLSATLLGKTPRPFSFAYLGQGIALGGHNAIGFNNYPEDKPIPPYFTGWLGYQIREIFVRYLAAAPRLERHWPGLFVWPGKGRYEHTLRRQQVKAKQNAIQLVEYNEGS